MPNKLAKHNYSYFPIFIDKKKYGISRDELYEKLKDNNIYRRRYCYPLISHFPPYNTMDTANANNLHNAEMLANEVICLPMFVELA